MEVSPSTYRLVIVPVLLALVVINPSWSLIAWYYAGVFTSLLLSRSDT